jgi:hypothetical protein
MHTLDALRFNDGSITLIVTGELPEITYAGVPVKLTPARIEGNPWCVSMAITTTPHPDPNAWQASFDCDPAASEVELVIDGKPATLRWLAPPPAAAPKPAQRSRRRG